MEIQNVRLILNLFSFVFAGLLLGCKLKSPENNKDIVHIAEIQNQIKLYNFEVRKSLKSPSELFLSDFTSEIKYIPLETNPECLISKISTVEIHDGYIFILDARIGYYKFDMSGNFIQKIGKTGNGPGEYGMVFYSAIFKKYKEIWLYCYPVGKVNIYDLETGNYKRNLKFNFQTSGYIEFPSGYITSFISQIGHQPDPYEIAVVNNDGKLIDTIPESRLPLKKSGAVGYTINYIYGDSLFYMDGFYDTLYHISKDIKKRPYASLGLGNKIKANEIEIKNLPHINQYPEFIQVRRILENDRFFFISLQKGLGVYINFDDHRLLYDKVSQQIVYCNELVNDIDGGLPFWPEYIFNNRELVKAINAVDILMHLKLNYKNNFKSDEFALMANKLNENNNPVLAIIELN